MAPKITCECGICRKCKHRVYMRDYYRRNAEKWRESAIASRNRRIEYVREYDRERGHRVYNIEHERARRRAYTAIANGTLVRQPCERCGSSTVEAHHEDYSKPLDVRWFCRKHHMELHRTVTA